MTTRTAADIKPCLTDGSEFALVDVREPGQYGEGHPFFAVNIPYSQLELRVEAMLPRKAIAMALLDDDDGVSERAKARLEAIGYTNVSVLTGGAQAWSGAGYTLYKGVNLPSKTLGEFVEHVAHTPRIDARQLAEMKERGEDFVLVDGRTPEEFRTMMIDGAICCPNAELGHRLPQILACGQTKIVVNCAGRTRSIIGAQGLINQGFENPVFALENGTQGWELAGFSLVRGASDNLPHGLDAETLQESRRRARHMLEKFGIEKISLATLRQWQADASRTLHVFDVRTREEFLAAHLPESLHAPGGQLVQATDKWVAARGARIVLVDDTGLRAANTAFWLRRMDHEVYVLEEDVTVLDHRLQGQVTDAALAKTLDTCQPGDMAEKLRNGALLIDIRPGMDFRKGHIEGAVWAIRPRLAKAVTGARAEIVLAAGDRDVAELAAIDLREMGFDRLCHLPGNIQSWRDAGLEIAATPNNPPDEDCIDHLFFVHDRHQGNLEAARNYLAWETGLMNQLDHQERSFFKLDVFAEERIGS